MCVKKDWYNIKIIYLISLFVISLIREIPLGSSLILLKYLRNWIIYYGFFVNPIQFPLRKIFVLVGIEEAGISYSNGSIPKLIKESIIVLFPSLSQPSDT